MNKLKDKIYQLRKKKNEFTSDIKINTKKYSNSTKKNQKF